MIDLATLRTVTTVDVPPQAGGIDILLGYDGHEARRAALLGFWFEAGYLIA